MITISRDSGYADKLRKYQVILDGERVVDIADGGTETFAANPSSHRLHLKVDWCRSNELAFHLGEGEEARFACSSPLRGVRILLALL